jgi:hypothetical protein
MIAKGRLGTLQQDMRQKYYENRLGMVCLRSTEILPVMWSLGQYGANSETDIDS